MLEGCMWVCGEGLLLGLRNASAAAAAPGPVAGAAACAAADAVSRPA